MERYCKRSKLLVVLWLALVGCGTAPRAVRLREGGDAARLVPPSKAPGAPVPVQAGHFQAVMGQLAAGVTPPAHPEQAARQLFQMEARSGDYAFEAKHHRLTPLRLPQSHAEAPSAEQGELVRQYLLWCGRTGTTGDCLRLLVDRPFISEEGRVTLALALAKGVVLEETLQALKGMADPQALEAALLWTMSTYLVLWSLPEPASKGLAAAMTVALIGYVGLDTFYALIHGFKLLEHEAELSTGFGEVRVAGERYGKVLGGSAARAFAMIALAALGRTAGEFSARLPRLPGYDAAVAQANGQVGVNLSAVAEVESVAMSGEVVDITLATGAVRMVAQGPLSQGEPEGDEDCCGEEHHPISRRIAKALDNHRTLKGLYKPRDSRFVVKAKDAAAHRGYQQWHRKVDEEVIRWLEENEFATPQQFEAFLRGIYSRPEMRMRFPNDF